jgi:hypothetical protein
MRKYTLVRIPGTLVEWSTCRDCARMAPSRMGIPAGIWGVGCDFRGNGPRGPGLCCGHFDLGFPDGADMPGKAPAGGHYEALVRDPRVGGATDMVGLGAIHTFKAPFQGSMVSNGIAKFEYPVPVILLGQEPFGRGRAEYKGVAEVVIRHLGIHGEILPDAAFGV